MAGDRLKSSYVVRGAKATGSFVTGYGDLKRSYEVHKAIVKRMWSPIFEAIEYGLAKRKRSYRNFQELVEKFDLSENDIVTEAALRRRHAGVYKVAAMVCLAALVYQAFKSPDISLSIIYFLLLVSSVLRSMEMDWRASQYEARHLMPFSEWLSTPEGKRK